ncbi:MAG: hypothetical protein R2752_10220 [Vicinamibacterales bacterium]
MARAVEPDTARAIDRAIRDAGFQCVALDLRGYRLGSLNEASSSSRCRRHPRVYQIGPPEAG